MVDLKVCGRRPKEMYARGTFAVKRQFRPFCRFTRAYALSDKVVPMLTDELTRIPRRRLRSVA